MHSFQLKLLRSEISTAVATHHKCDKERAASQNVLKILDNHLLQGKLTKLSERQDKPKRSSNEKTVVILDNIILPGFVRDLLAFGPKHPIRDKFKELLFWADIDSLIRNLRENNVPGEKLFENEAAAKVLKKQQ